MHDIAPVLAIFGLVIGICWLAWAIMTNRRQRDWMRLNAESQQRLLDKLGSTAEFSTFLESEGGRRFLDTFSVHPPEGTARRRILSALQAGTVLFFLGLGLLLVAFRMPFDGGAFAVMGAVALSTGVGFLVSAAISYRLMSNWEQN